MSQQPLKFKEDSMTTDAERIKEVVTTKVHLASNAIAGTVAGFTSSVVTHPLDVIKTRFQVKLSSQSLNVRKEA